MSTYRIVARSALLAALTVAAVAQGPLYPTESLVGSGNTLSGFPFPSIQRGVFVQDLAGAWRSNCALANGYRSEGGTAYDPRFQAVWIADNDVLKLIELRNCNVRTTGPAIHHLANSQISGLAFDPLEEFLWQLETTSSQFAITVYNTRDIRTGGRISKRSSSEGRVLSEFNPVHAGGLEFDEQRRLLYIGFTEDAGTRYRYVGLSRPATPCLPFCIPYLGAGSTMITGLAMDSGHDALFATDGLVVWTYALGAATPCAPTLTRTTATRFDYNGLAFIPTWQQAPVGSACLGTGCPQCGDMRIGTFGGDPVNNTTTFGVDLTGAPEGFGILLINAGTCTGAQQVFCGTLLVLPNFIALSAPIVGASCAGRAQVLLPIPATLPTGLTLCAQWGVICTPAMGIGLSNALQFTIVRH